MTTEQKHQALVPELYCSNFSSSLHFYAEKIGFEILYSREEEKFAYLKLGNAELMIEEPNENGDRVWWTGQAEKPYGRGINFQIEVEDVDQLFNRISQYKIPLFLEMENKWYRKGNHEVGNRQFIVQDPDGYLLRFYSSLGVK